MIRFTALGDSVMPPPSGWKPFKFANKHAAGGSPILTIKGDCADLITDCETHKANGGCNPDNANHHGWRFKCRQTCGYCYDDRYNGNCEDTITDCATHMKNGGCLPSNS